jgi:hypothetical protein
MKPLRQFPATYKELDAYDVLIFGDVDPTALVPTPSKLNQVLKNIQKFVDYGGGLAVIAGEGWTPHAYADTALEEVLPIDVGRGGDAVAWADFSIGWKPKLTALGRNHPIVQLARDCCAGAHQAIKETDSLAWSASGQLPRRPVRRGRSAARRTADHSNLRGVCEVAAQAPCDRLGGIAHAVSAPAGVDVKGLPLLARATAWIRQPLFNELIQRVLVGIMTMALPYHLTIPR